MNDTQDYSFLVDLGLHMLSWGQNDHENGMENNPTTTPGKKVQIKTMADILL